MEKVNLKFVRSETREHDSGKNLYNIFLTEENRQLAIKKNKTIVAFEQQKGFIPGKIYPMYLDLNSCYGIDSDDIFIFYYAAGVVMRKNAAFFELNPRSRKPLTDEKMKTFMFKFLAKSGDKKYAYLAKEIEENAVKVKIMRSSVSREERTKRFEIRDREILQAMRRLNAKEIDRLEYNTLVDQAKLKALNK